MNKQALLFFAIVLWNTFAFAQCPSTNITLTTQQEVDDFAIDYPSCTNLTVDLVVDGSGITNLSGLNQLVEVGFVLAIENTSTLNLSGLNNLTTIGDGAIRIRNNASLTDISALANVVGFDRSINIRDNPSLNSLSGVEWLTDCTNLTLVNNDALVDLSGLNNLTSANIIFIENDGLMSLSGLENLTSVLNFFSLIRNDVLTNISAINNNLSAGSFNIIDNPMLSNCAVQAICDHIDNGGTTNISGNAMGCASAMEIETECAALPVELINFKGKEQAGTIQLNWQTASEINNQGFEIEWSNDGRAWQKIGWIDGNGSTSSINDYSFIHRSPHRGFNYYRLKQLDFDGAFEYSSILVISFNGQTEFSIYPNPATDELFLELDERNVEINIYSITGGLVKTVKSVPENYLIDISDLKSGIYSLEVRSVKGVVFQQFIKTKM